MKKKMKVSNILKDLFDKLDGMINDNQLAQKKIMIWGCQKASYIASQYLSEKSCDVVGIVDNNEKLIGEPSAFIQRAYEKIKPMKVYLPEDIIAPYSEENIILVFSKHYDSILKQASEYGYNADRCILVFNSESVLNTDDFNGLNEIHIDERKKIQFEILCFLKKVCNEHNLRYYLGYGTLLGAVRHKGYIPWDDDIDVCMPWSDYNKLINLFVEKKVFDEKYSLMCHSTCDNYSWIYAKIQDNRTISRGVRFPLICDIGVNIDIFPLSGFPALKSEQNEINKLRDSFWKKWSKHFIYWNLKSDYD